MSANIPKQQSQQLYFNQHNTIVITGLPSLLCNAQILGSKQWFGEFGITEYICIINCKNALNPETVYIKYCDPLSASKAIQKLNLYKIPDTDNILNVHYADNNSRTLLMNHEEKGDESEYNARIQKQETDITMKQTIHETERAMLEEEIQSLKHYIESMESSLNKDNNDSLKALHTENDRIRIKNCTLIRDYNILQRDYKIECGQLKKKLSDTKMNYNTLDNRYMWLQKQLESMMRSNSELQKLMFSDSSTLMNNAYLYHSYDQVEGASDPNATI